MIWDVCQLKTPVNSVKNKKKKTNKQHQGFIKLSFNCIQCIWTQDLIHNIRQNILKQGIVKMDSLFIECVGNTLHELFVFQFSVELQR